MLIYQIMALVAITLGLAVFLLRWRRRWSRRESQPDYGIHLCIPLAAPVELDCSQLVRQFQARWGSQVRCSEHVQQGGSKRRTRGYLLTDGRNGLLLTVAQRPLPRGLAEISLAANWHLHRLNDEQKSRFARHRAYVNVRYAVGIEDATERVRFSVQALLTLLQVLEGATGYVNVRGQLYAPVERIDAVLRGSPLEPPNLFMLFANTHIVGENDGLWIHTHGLEQFGLPDLEMRTSQPEDLRRSWELMASAAEYVMARGRVLKVGQTVEFGDDGVVYLLRQARKQTRHPYGKFGALELVPA